jgi:hypothetical protein
MTIHRALGDEQPGADLLVAPTFGDEPRDIDFASADRSTTLPTDLRKRPTDAIAWRRDPSSACPSARRIAQTRGERADVRTDGEVGLAGAHG